MVRRFRSGVCRQTFGVIAGVMTFALGISSADLPQPQLNPLPRIDKRSRSRSGSLQEEMPVPAEKADAIARLRGRVSSVRVEFDEVLGTPKSVSAPGGFLSGLQGRGRAISEQTAAIFGAADSHRAAKAFLTEYQGLFGHGVEALTQARIVRDYVTQHNGMRTVIWEQELDGLKVFESTFVAHTTRNNELISLSARFVPDLEKAANADARAPAVRMVPAIDGRQAVASATANLNEPVRIEEVAAVDAQPAGTERRQRFKAPPFNGEIETRLLWLPMSAERLQLCWEVMLTSRARGETFRLLVNALNGEVVLRRCLTVYASDASYRVFTSDSPTPLSPGLAEPSSTQPPLAGRSLVTWSALNTNASPRGWINDGDNETRGNNVDAHLDRDANNVPDVPRPHGSPARVFDFPWSATQTPEFYRDASVVQLFYWCNWAHDRLYELGFTEAAGNFQNDNFGRGGLGNDAVQADAQDAASANNANFTPTADGQAPRIQMFLWDGAPFFRDGSFDAEVVLHEYVHGLSDRLVGGGAGLSELQSRGLSEGWSDFYALSLLSQPGDDLGGNYAMGAYVVNGLVAENYYYGIRRYPYSTNLARDPLTLRDIDPAQAVGHSGVPLSPRDSPFNPNLASEVHNQGEVWCSVLWEMRANLITRHGFSTGNLLALRLTTDGMKLTPPNPNFTQARDAILLADQVNTGGANDRELWTAFARRGLGFSASAPPSFTTAGVVEAFDLPDNLRITPRSGFTANGPPGGPFDVSAVTYTLANPGTSLLNWSLVNNSAWLSAAPVTGQLLPGATNSVMVSLTATAGLLPTGAYSGTLLFSNRTSGAVQTRNVTLRVGQPDFFTELFESMDNDLAYRTFNFTPDASTSRYTVCRLTATNFPTDPADGIVLGLGDDSFGQVNLSGGRQVSIYGNHSGTIFIGANGYVTLNSGDTAYEESLAAHFNRPRVSALFDDLNPGIGGAISWKQMSNRVAVTWQDVPEYGASNRRNNFQIEMFFDGRLRLTYLDMASRGGLAGLSAGTGVPANFAESDLSAIGACTAVLTVFVPSGATEGDGLLAGRGEVRLAVPATNDLVVSLGSTDPTEATVPEGVLILAGQTNATFDITVLDDAELDGTQTTFIVASATNYVEGIAAFAVSDNETATLALTLPASGREGSGVVTGMVSVSAAPAANVMVDVVSSRPADLQSGRAVVIAGQTSAPVSLAIVDDLRIDGAQRVTVTAQVAHWNSASVELDVLDNESTNLVLAVPAQVVEGEGTRLNAGLVQTAGTLPTDLLLTVVSSDPARVRVPNEAVTIPAGRTSATFDLAMADNQATEGTQSVRIVVSAVGFLSATQTIAVADNDAHHFEFGIIPSPQYTGTVFQVTLTAHEPGGQRVFAYNGSASLSLTGDAAGLQLRTPASIAFTNGQWTGYVGVDTIVRHARLFATNVAGAAGSSVLFNVVAPPLRVMNLSAADLIYEPFGQRLWVSGTDGSISNTIASINPAAGSVSATVPMGDRPGRLVASPNGQYLYAAISNDTALRRVTLSVLTASPPATVSGRLTDMDVTLASPVVFAVARDNSTTGLYLWPDQSGVYPGTYRSVEFDENSVLYGGPNPLTRMSISRVVLSSFNVNNGIGLGDDFKYAGGLVYYAGGVVADGVAQRVVGVYPIVGTGLSVRPDLALGKVFFLAGDGGGWSIQSFDRTRFFQIHSMPLPGVTGTPTNLVRWGSDGLAFRTTGGQIYLVNGSVLIPSGAQAGLRVTQVPLGPAPVAGSNWVLSIVVSNQGPFEASGVRLFDTLPEQFDLISAAVSQGVVATSGRTVTAHLGFVDQGATATLTLTVRPNVGGWIANSAYVLGNEADADLNDNTSTVYWSVGIAGGPDSVGLLSLPANDLVFDATRQKLYASVSNAVPQLSNTVVVIDPASGFIESTIPIGVRPTRLAVSDNGQYLYAATGDGTLVRRWNFASQSVDLQFAMGNFAPGQPFRVADIEAFPGAPGSVAIGRATDALDTHTVIFDNGTARPNTTPITFGMDHLEFGSNSSRLYTFSGWRFRIVTLDASGAASSVENNIFNAWPDADLAFDNGLLFHPDGSVVDPEQGRGIWRLPGVNGPVVIDHAASRALCLTPSGAEWALAGFDRESFMPLGSASLPGVTGTPGRLVRWGGDGVAFRTSSNQLVIARTLLLPTASPTDLAIRQVGTPTVAGIGDSVTYTLTVTNRGANAAPGVLATNGFTGPATIESATASQGACVIAGGAVRCALGSLVPGGNASVTIRVRTSSAGTILSAGAVRSTALDQVHGNNRAWAFTAVTTGSTTENIAMLDFPTLGMAGNPVSGRIYASTPDGIPEISRSILEMDPERGTIGPAVFAGSIRNKLAVNTAGTVLHAAGDSVKLFDLPSLTPTVEYPLGGQPDDIQVVPGSPRSLAVSRAGEIAVYDNGVLRNNVSPPRPGSHTMAFGADATRLYAHGNGGAGLLRLAVDSAGVTLLDATIIQNPAAVDMKYAGGLLYFSFGNVVNPAAPALADVVPEMGSYAAFDYDARNDMLFFVDFSNDWYLRALDRATLAPAGRVNVPGILGAPKKVIRTGTNGVVVNTTYNQLYFIRTGLVPQGPEAEVGVTLAESMDPSVVGSNLTYQATVVNRGPAAANDVVLTNRLQPSVLVVSSSASQGYVSYSTGLVVCALGSLPAGGTATVSFVVRPAMAGLLTCTSQVASIERDLSRSNNIAVTATTVRSAAADSLIVLSLPTKELVYDKTRGHLYASVPGSAGVFGNSVIRIDPESGVVGDPIHVGPEPGLMAISDDGQFLYVGLDRVSAVRRVNLATQLPDLLFPVTPDTYPSDIEVMPGNPNVVAVARQYGSGVGAGIAIYDRGVKRSQEIGSGLMAFSDTTGTLYYSPQPYSLYRTIIDSNGITLGNGVPTGRQPFADLKIRDGRMYWTLGRVDDPENERILGSFSSSFGNLVEPDPEKGRTYFLVPAQVSRLFAFDNANFLPVGSNNVPGVVGLAANFLRWGTNGFAFRTPSQVFILRSGLVPNSPPTDLALAMTGPSNAVPLGDTVNYSLEVRNQGAIPSQAVLVAHDLSLNVSNIFASSSLGSCRVTNGTVFCDLGTLNAGSTAMITVQATPLAAGTLTATANVTASSPDPTQGNNTVVSAVLVASTNDPDTILRMKLPTKDLIYDPVSEKLYASVPGWFSGLGNSIVPIDPATASVGEPIWVGSEPSKLAVSDDGHYMYVVLDGPSAIRRVDLHTRMPGLQFPIHPSGPANVWDMMVQPGNPDVLAVTRGSPSDYYGDVVMYNQGIELPNRIELYTGDKPLEFSRDGTHLYGFDGIGSYGFLRMSVGSNGLSALDGPDIPRASDLELDNGLLYFSSGHVIDPDIPAVVGVCQVSGFVRPDSGVGRTFFLTPMTGSWEIRACDQRNFQTVAIQPMPGLAAPPGSLLRCGGDRLAFRTSASQVFIFSTLLVPSGQPADLRVSQSRLPDLPVLGSNLTFAIVVTNAGPGRAQTATVSVELPEHAVFVAASASQGVCNNQGTVVSCALGTLDNGRAATISVVVRPTRGGLMTNLVTAAAAEIDPDLGNNFTTDAFLVRIAPGPSSLTPILLPTRDIVYEPITRRVLATCPGGSPLFANSVLPIDPLTFAVDAPIPVGPEPGIMALSSNRQYFYVSVETNRAIQRVDLVSRAVLQTFHLGSTGNTAFVAADIAVLPNNPAAVAVVRRLPAATSSGFIHDSVAIYDAGVARTNIARGIPHGYAEVLAFGASPTTLFSVGYGTGFQRLAVDAGGVAYVYRDANVMNSSREIRYAGGLVYGSSGEVFDPTSSSLRTTVPSVDGSSQVLPDVASGRLIFAYGSSLRVHDLATLVYLGDIALPGLGGSVLDLIRCGEDALAFRTAGDLLFILRDPLIAIAPASDIAVGLTGPSAPVFVRSNATYVVTMTNRGPAALPGASLVFYRPSASAVISVSNSQGTVTLAGNEVRNFLGPLTNGATATMAVTLFFGSSGLYESFVSAAGWAPDLVPSNNSATNTLAVSLNLPPDGEGSVALVASDLAYDPFSQRLFAATAPQGGKPASIYAIDPESGRVTNWLSLSNTATRLILADNGQFLHALVDEGRGIQRVHLPSRTKDLYFATGQQTPAVLDIEPAPGQPGVVAVARSTGVAIFDNGVRRPNITGGGIPIIEFGATASELYGFNSTTLFRMPVDGNGVYVVSVRTYDFLDPDVKFAEGQFFTTQGRVFSAPSGELLTTLPGTGLIGLDLGLRRIFYLGDHGPFARLLAFDMATYGPVGSRDFPGFLGGIGSPTRCGGDRIAFRTGYDIRIVRTSMVPANDPGVTLSLSPSVGVTGRDLTASIAVSNTGPLIANGVLLTNSLPANVRLSSVSLSQGSWSNIAGQIVCQLGALPSNATATLTIVMTPTNTATQYLTNTVTVSAGGLDARNANNRAVAASLIYPDLDRDGMGDDWERDHGLNPASPADASADPDHDGLTNVQEFQAGTDPNDPASDLRVVDIRVLDADVHLRFFTVQQRRYQVERSDLPSGGTWQPAAPVVLGDGTLRLSTDSGGARQNKRFYRLRIVD